MKKLMEGAAERRVAFDLRRGGGIDEPGRKIDNIGMWKKDMISFMNKENEKTQKMLDRLENNRKKDLLKHRINTIGKILTNLNTYVFYDNLKNKYCFKSNILASKFPYFNESKYFTDVNGLMEHLENGICELPNDLPQDKLIIDYCGSIENLQNKLQEIGVIHTYPKNDYSKIKLDDFFLENNKNMKNNKKQIIRLTESDLHKLIKRSVNKILKEDSADHYFGWMDDKDYSQFDDDERRDLEQELDFRDSLNDYHKDKQMNSDWNDLDVDSEMFNQDAAKNGEADLERMGNHNLYDTDGWLGMNALSDKPSERSYGQSPRWRGEDPYADWSLNESIKRNVRKIIHKSIIKNNK